MQHDHATSLPSLNALPERAGQSTSWGANVYSPNGLVIITTYRPRPDSEIEALAWRASADGDVLRVSQAMAGNPFERSLCGAVDIVDGSIIVLGAPNGQRVGLDKDTPGCALQAVAWHDEVSWRCCWHSG